MTGNSYAPTDGLFRIMAEPQLDMDAGGCCGDVFRYNANVALNIGDAVHLISGTANKVTKTTTTADHGRVVGVVVGGAKTYMQIITDPGAYNVVQAAAIGEQVLVLFDGIIYVIAGGTIAEGDNIRLDTGTAGRVIATVAQSIAAPAISGAPALTGAPDKGTLAIAAGATPVTSAAANGTSDIGGAPGIGSLAATAGTLVVAAPVISGDGTRKVFGKMLQTATAGQIKLALIHV